MDTGVKVAADGAFGRTEIETSIVILTYARDETLKTTLARLKEKAGALAHAEVVIVDNNPDDHDRSELVADFPNWQVVKTGSNKGVWARNYGIEAARGEMVVLLDDDVLVETDDFLRLLQLEFAARPDVGLVTIKKLDGKTMTQLPECIPHPKKKTVDPDKPFLTFRFTGGLIAIRRTMYRQIGGYSRDIFFGHEEHEYAFRVVKAGWKIYYQPGVVAIETNAGGGRRTRAEERRDMLSNRYILDYLHLGASAMVIDMLVFTLGLLVIERGKLDVVTAIRHFRAWLAKPDRAARTPISAATKAYIRSCGG